MISRITSITSIGLLALLAGCGGGGGGSPPPPPPPPPVDTTPNNFTFTGQSGSARLTTVNSNEVTVSGINAAAAISITGGEYSIDGGAFTSAAGSINNNQRVTVRVNTSGDFSAAANAVLTVGGVSATFTATTLAADTTPDAFAFTSGGGSTARNVVLTSNNVTITGLNTGAPISIANGEYSINGGAFTAAAGTITNSQQVTVRLTTSGQFSTAVNAVLTVGGVTGTFSATTLAEDIVPDAFGFQASSNSVRGALVASNAVSITGINNTTPVSVQNGEYSIAGSAYRTAAGTIEPGQNITLRVRAPSVYSKSARATVTIGGVSADFEVTAELPDYIPEAVDFDGTNVVYLLSNTNRLVFRWSISEARYLDPYELSPGAFAPTQMAYVAAHQRLYLGQYEGVVRYFDVTAASATETTFATLASGVTSLSSAGNFLAVQGTFSYNNAYLVNRSGAITDQGGYYYGYSRQRAWDPVTSRVYYYRDGISPNDLHYDVIDAAGLVTAQGETPYHGDYGFFGPIRVSPDGQRVLLGSGDIFAQNDLTWTGSLGAQFADARWFANGSLVALRTANNSTVLRRLAGTNFTTVLEQLPFTGEALRVFGSDERMAIVLLNNGTVQFHIYVPNDDNDADGVVNTQDAFPLDRAASVDSDRDGYPDAWNSGRSQADSTTGLSLDAFAQDSACWLTAHGTGGVCDYTATLPDFVPDQVVSHGDIIYLLSEDNRRVYRWSMATRQYLNPFVVSVNQGFDPVAPGRMALSADQQRLYLGYSTGAIHYIDLASGNPAEVAFTHISLGVRGLAAVGNYLLAQDDSGAWSTHYVINSAGVITDHRDWNYYSSEYAWDPVSSRVYFFRDDTSPNDLHYEVIDQGTGLISGANETPYHGDYDLGRPIRVSANGQYVLLGSGNLFDRNGLTWAGALSSRVTDARWLATGSLVTLTTSGNQTVLRHLSGTSLVTLEQQAFTGEALHVVGSDTRMALVLLEGGTVQFQIYVPNNDGDGDGVLNTQDAFPLDRAASIDTDGDGHPDSWNAGRSQADSTTGLALDAFANEAECWLVSHGSGGACNYGATMPDYTPDQVVQQGDVVYLLSAANRRVYRWSISGGAYLKPYVVGVSQGYSTLGPTAMAYVNNHQRLYFGYINGTIRYIAPNAGPATSAFTSLPEGVMTLGNAGNFLLVQTGGYYGTGYILNSSAVLMSNAGYYNGYSRETAWDSTASRLYYFRNYSQNNLYYDVINQTTGLVTSTGEVTNPGNRQFNGVIRVSGNGQSILLGTGDIFTQPGLVWSGSLGLPVTDARWFADGSLATLTGTTSQTVLRRLSSTNQAELENQTFTGEPLRVVGSDTQMVVIVRNNGTVQFHNYAPDNDSDNDGVSNTSDAFPQDVAASVDTDHDGYPDAWNAGRSQADSTTGLTLDAFAQDSACWLSGHGSGGVCNYGATVPNYIPEQVVQHGDIVYLLSNANRRVYRWSISAGAYRNPYIVGISQGSGIAAPTKMAYSPNHQRLYVGYATGQVRYLNSAVANPAETSFASLGAEIIGLTSTGNYLVAHNGNQYSPNSSYVLNSSGATTDRGFGYYAVNQYTWDPVYSRLYHITISSGTALYYEVIDQGTGEVSAFGSSDYDSNLSSRPPGRVSVDGEHILIGSGNIYSRSGLAWEGTVGSLLVDARWFADGSFATLVNSGGQAVLRRLGNNNLMLFEQRAFAGEALRVVGSDTAMAVLVINNNTVQFHSYVPNNDTDNDGVLNTVDAFPLDPAASVDTDRDGYPDSWNPGRSQADSTTGLVLDAFPAEAACWLSSHGIGGVCNFGATIPNYIPDQVAQRGDVVYLLSIANRRVYRWSIATGAYLSPYVVGNNQGYGTMAPTAMAYSTGQQRLYVGYGNGVIRYLDANAANPAEVTLTMMQHGVTSLSNAGNFLLAQTSGGYGSGYILSSSGVVTGQGGYYYGYSRETAWDAASSRVYYLRDGISPNNLHFDVIDQTTGVRTTMGEANTPYPYAVTGPVSLSPDASQILLGDGSIYARTGFTRTDSIGKSIVDGYWKDNLIVDVDQDDLIEIRDADTRAVLHTYDYTGVPIRLVFGSSDAYLVHNLNNTTAFVRLAFFDQDGDTITRWWEQRYANGGAGMSDTNSADATTDLDGDGANNLTEFQNLTNPLVADTDGDGLTDSQEIVTWHSNPRRTDTDADGLSDYAEVITHHSNPLVKDTDGDGYEDRDEVLYGGNPNDSTSLPQPLSSYTQTFEGGPTLTHWTTPAQDGGAWFIDGTSSHVGFASFKSGTVIDGQTSAVRFRNIFRAGRLNFWVRVEPGYCCNVMYVSVDGAQQLYLSGSSNNQWTNYEIYIPAGIHTIEWRYQRAHTGVASVDSAWIDDVVFTAQP